MDTPQNNDLHWAAGFLEGEGSFIRTSMGGQRKYYRYPAVRASQVNREPLEKLYKIFGGSITLDVRDRYRRAGQNVQDIYAWNVAGLRAATIMRLLRPLMSKQRRAQISKSLEGYHGMKIVKLQRRLAAR